MFKKTMRMEKSQTRRKEERKYSLALHLGYCALVLGCREKADVRKLPDCGKTGERKVRIKGLPSLFSCKY